MSYRGRLLVAFRPGPNRSLVAFGGYDCSAIALDGIEYRFADKPMEHLAWAPVTENRHVAGGARLELWAHGHGEVRIPLSGLQVQGRLFFEGPRLGTLGAALPVRVRDGVAVFSAVTGWPQKHLYLL